MAISKPGLVSLILGILIVAAAYWLGFQNSGIFAMLITTMQGGIILLGLFLMLIGFLMVII
ncbi:MAG: hypothetical protein V1835_02060 [Candidatus Micrarchaeota archaeon]